MVSERFLVVEASSFSCLKNSTQESNSRWYHPKLLIFQAPFATKPYLSCLGSTGILIHWAFKSAQKHVHMVKGHPESTLTFLDFKNFRLLRVYEGNVSLKCWVILGGCFLLLGHPNQVASWALGWLTSCTFTKETSAMYIPPLNHWNSQEKLIRNTL